MTHAEIAAMPLAEKLQFMELLWDDLQRSAPTADIVPEWHLTEVAERTRSLDDGTEGVVPLDAARRRLREMLARR